MIAAIQGSSLASAGLSGANASTAQIPGMPTQAQATEAAPFADLVTDTLRDASTLEDQAHRAVEGLMTGSGVDVHQAIIASEKASMEFEMALAFRNKAIQSYQTVMNMQF